MEFQEVVDYIYINGHSWWLRLRWKKIVYIVIICEKYLFSVSIVSFIVTKFI